MPFTKGISGNANGKAKGATSKATKDLRQWIAAFVDKNTKQVESDWMKLDPKDRIIMFEKLLKYTLPTLQAMSNTVKFEDLSDFDLDKIIKSLKQTANNRNEI